MITGIAVLGVLSGSPASFFGLDQDDTRSADDEVGGAPGGSPAASVQDDDRYGATAVNAALRELTAEVAALRLPSGHSFGTGRQWRAGSSRRARPAVFSSRRSAGVTRRSVGVTRRSAGGTTGRSQIVVDRG
jgi:hypothetical protein